jgi:hypothetical protein
VVDNQRVNVDIADVQRAQFYGSGAFDVKCSDGFFVIVGGEVIIAYNRTELDATLNDQRLVTCNGNVQQVIV